MAAHPIIGRIKRSVPPAWQATAAWRALRACYGAWNRLPFEAAEARVRLSRAARLRAMAAGLPLRPRYLVLGCNETPEGSGLFSEVAMVLAALDRYERWHPRCAGLRVDFGTGGLYYDAAHGPNWWNYFFEPVDVGSPAGAVLHAPDLVEHDVMEQDGGRLPLGRARDLVARHIRPRAAIREEVDRFAREALGDAFVVGIHFRGTDHAASDPRVPWERVREAAQAAAGRAGGRPVRYFVATDERAFLEDMCARYPGQVAARDIFRSADGRPIDLVNPDGGYRKGADAVIDCLLLARCDFLVRTESHLSASARLFNPSLEDVLLA